MQTSSKSYRLVSADWENIADGILVEEETLPNSCYLRDNSAYFLEQTRGELTIVYDGDTPVGVGKLSILPDGSGWLETLRVRQAWQGQGVGKTLYRHWLAQRETYGCHALRMFTGVGNLRSKGLAEKNGFSVAGTVIGATRKLSGVSAFPKTYDFSPVRDRQQALMLLQQHCPRMQGFVVLNNTFFRTEEKTWDYLWEQGMVFADRQQNLVVLGARMLRERGLHLAMYGGDGEKCLGFALAYTAGAGLPQLTVSYPPAQAEIRQQLEKLGFLHDPACRIVMERSF